LGASGGIAYASIGQNLDGEVNPLTGLVLQPNATKPWYPKVAIHELGHLGPFLLLDEYGNSEESIDSATQAEIDASPNLTSTLSPLKWDALKTPDVHLPTDCRLEPTPEVGAAPGGEGYATGVFHARCACRMNKFLHDSFCPVCRQQIVLSLGGATFNTPWKMRMLADSVVMEIASDGYYFIRIKVPGVKPPLPPLRGDPKPLRAFGRTFEADGILLELPASSEVPNRIEYELMRATSATAADASVVERGMLPIRSTRPGARIEQFDMKTHRVTVGVIIR
jgi:hypothetical protein